MATPDASSPSESAIADHLDGLRLHLRRRLACEHDVADLAQEACLKMLQAERNGAIRQPRAYLHQIANHLLYQHYTGRTQRLQTGLDPDDIASPELPLEETINRQLRRQQIEQVMQTFSHKCRTAVILRWRDGLRVNEIAVHMNLSRGMVKKYLASALGQFRKRCRAW